jgi:hypothetical protein
MYQDIENRYKLSHILGTRVLFPDVAGWFCRPEARRP